MYLQRTLTVFVVLCGSLLRPTVSVTGLLQVYYYRQPKPSISSPPQSWKVDGLATWINSSAFVDNLDCNTTSNDGAGISWTGQVPISPYWILNLAKGKRLALESFTDANLGIYTCYDSATNESLTVNITSANPAVQAVNSIVTVEAGSTAQLKVYVSGIPDGSGITWFKVLTNSNLIELMGTEVNVNISGDRRTLLLSNVHESDGGVYKCIVTQNFYPYPSATAIIQLVVTKKNYPAAMFTQQPASLSLIQSANATLSCSANASSAPNITWKRNGGNDSLPSTAAAVTAGNSTTTTSTLFLLNVQSQDGGQYQCLATVAGATPILSQPAFIQVQPQSTPQSPSSAVTTTPTISGTAPGTTGSTITPSGESTCDPMQSCSSSQGSPTPLPVLIAATAAGGGGVFVMVAVCLLLYVCVYFRYCKPRKGDATWPENGPVSSTNVVFRAHGVEENGEVLIQSQTVFEQPPGVRSNPPNVYTALPLGVCEKEPVYSPLTAPEESITLHEYSGVFQPSPPTDGSYSRFQRDSIRRNPSSAAIGESTAQRREIAPCTAVAPPSGEQRTSLPGDAEINTGNRTNGAAGGGAVPVVNAGAVSLPPPPPAQPLTQTAAGKIPMWRHGSNVPPVVPEGPASIYSSNISALSSVPASNLSITSPSNLFNGLSEGKAPVANRTGEKSGSSALPSVPEHVVSLHRYENVVLPLPAVKRVPTLEGVAVAKAPELENPPAYGEAIAEQPWYELEEADSDVSVPVAGGAARRFYTLPQPHVARAGGSTCDVGTQNAAMENGPRHPHITYRGSLSSAPVKTDSRREAFFSASTLSCGTAV